jgi:dephospho-CoA kinase
VLRIAVTGPIASGKSAILAELATRGVPVMDLDAFSREVTRPGHPLIRELEARFGEGFVPGGVLDRAAMRRLIARDPEARKSLEDLIHPEVLGLMEREIARLAARGERAAAVEFPLLFELGVEGQFDAVLVAVCPPETSIERLAMRGIERDEAERMLSMQLPVEVKAARAKALPRGFVVDTTGPLEGLALLVERILQSFGLETEYART